MNRELFLPAICYMADGFCNGERILISSDKPCIVDFKYSKGVLVEARVICR